ncbi:MAG: hypothetical protein AB7S68_05170 [Polyangiaceae bacterium]
MSAASTPEPDEHEVLFEELVAIARSLGLEVRSERFQSSGPVSGALCRLRGKQIILLDQGAPSYERAHTVAAVLSRYPAAPLTLGGPAWRLVRKAGRERKAGEVRVPVIEFMQPPIPRKRGKPGIRTCSSGIEPPKSRKTRPRR